MEDNGKGTSETDFCQNGDDSCNIDPGVAVFVSEFLQYKLGQCGFQWRSSLVPAREAGNRNITPKVGVALRSLADEFSSQYKDQFVEMCGRLDINAETMKPTIEGVANELFSEGIKWARIVALFVFGSELAMHCKNRNWPDLINVIACSLSSYISEKLLPWINDHGGWDGLIVFQESDGNNERAPNRWPSVKNLLCLGISALGAITLGAVLTKS